MPPSYLLCSTVRGVHYSSCRGGQQECMHRATAILTYTEMVDLKAYYQAARWLFCLGINDNEDCTITYINSAVVKLGHNFWTPHAKWRAHHKYSTFLIELNHSWALRCELTNSLIHTDQYCLLWPALFSKNIPTLLSRSLILRCSACKKKKMPCTTEA